MSGYSLHEFRHINLFSSFINNLKKKHAEFSCFLSTRGLASYHDLGMKKFSWLEISHADTAHTLSSKSLFIKKSIQISTPQLVN